MTSNLRSLMVSILGDTKAFDKSMNDLQKKMDAVGKNLSSVGKKMSTFVTLPLVGIGVAALKTASDMEETESKFNVVFGELAEQTRTWAEEFGESMNRSTKDVLGWMSTLQDTFVPLGFARDQGTEMSKTLAQLTVDMASFNNESEANVIRDLQSALVGNHETMRKYGVIITQATLEQELFNMGIEGGVKDATEQEKVLARMNIILAGTTDAQGDAARTSESFANQMRGLKAQFVEVLTAIGKDLIPIVTKLIGKIQSGLKWFSNLDDRQRKLIITIAGIVAALGPFLLIAGQLIAAISALIPVMAAVNAVMAANPILAVVAAAALLATGAILLIKNWDKVKEFFTGLWETMLTSWIKIKEFFIGLWNKLQELLDRVPNWVLIMMPFVGLPLLIIKNWGQIKDFMINLMNIIKEQLVDRLLGIVDKVKEGVEKVTGFFKNMFDKVVGESYVPDMVDRISEDFDRLKNVMKDNAEEAAESTKTIFGYLADYMENEFKQSMQSTMESVWTGTADIATKIKDTIKGLISDILKGLGRKYAALAAAFFWRPVQALKYLAASVALFAAAGAVQRLAEGADFVTQGPQLVMVGDNPGGQERVQVTPLTSPNINGPRTIISAPLILQIDSGPIYEGLLVASENGMALLNKDALVE